MNEKIEKIYSTNCIFDKQCSPVYVNRTYESGITHLSTQCQKCGSTFGQPISRKSIDKTAPVKKFDEELYNKFSEEYFKPLFELSEKQRKLNEIRKSLKIEYYEKVFNIKYVDFDTTYNFYLSSPAWQEKRRNILERDNHTCLFCGTNTATQVHHLSYDNLGNETEFELISVCHPCHQTIHDIENNERIYDKLQKKSI